MLVRSFLPDISMATCRTIDIVIKIGLSSHHSIFFFACLSEFSVCVAHFSFVGINVRGVPGVCVCVGVWRFIFDILIVRQQVNRYYRCKGKGRRAKRDDQAPSHARISPLCCFCSLLIFSLINLAIAITIL